MWCNTWRNEGCSISSDITDFPDIGSTSFLLWSTIFPHPLVISEFAHPFKYQVLPLSLWYLELYQQSSPSLLKDTWTHPLWHHALSYHLGVTTHSSFAYFFVSSPCDVTCQSHPRTATWNGQWEDSICMASHKNEFVWESAWFYKKMSANRDFKMNH